MEFQIDRIGRSFGRVGLPIGRTSLLISRSIEIINQSNGLADRSDDWIDRSNDLVIRPIGNGRPQKYSKCWLSDGKVNRANGSIDRPNEQLGSVERFRRIDRFNQHRSVDRQTGSAEWPSQSGE